MKYAAGDVKRLLTEIEKETGIKLSRASCPDVQKLLMKKYSALNIGPLPFYGDYYIYRYLMLPLKEKLAKMVSVKPANMEAIARALGYAGYAQFELMQHPNITPSLASCQGNWYSYVRCNSGHSYVLRAPVHICIENRIMRIILKGTHEFKGKMQAEGDCITCLLENNAGKKLHLILKTGKSESPEVLQGVFSGISTAGDPIAGREILIRQDCEFATLARDRISIDELLNQPSGEEFIVGQYFRHAEKNIVKGGQSSSFRLDDLEERKV